jgi:hypothetical protein
VFERPTVRRQAAVVDALRRAATAADLADTVRGMPDDEVRLLLEQLEAR